MLVLTSAVALLTACGGDDDSSTDQPTRPKAVTGKVELERPPAGAPDAGTTGGHNAPDAIASTSRTSFTVRGTVQPAHSRVLIRNSDTNRDRAARVEPDGRFAAEAAPLRRGPNAFVIQGRARGHKAWSIDVSIRRR